MNKNFDQWIRDCAPEYEIDEINKETHLAVLKESLRQQKLQRESRKKWQLRASMAATVMVIVLVSGHYSPLGSDGFEATVLDIPVNDQGKFVIFGMRGTGMRVPEDQSDDETARLVSRFAARLGEPVRVHGFLMEGRASWRIERTITDGDFSRTYSVPAQEPQSKNEKKISLFILAEWLSVLKDIESGKIPIIGTKQVIADGLLFDAVIYEIHSSEFGEITYITGTPVK